MIDRNRPVHCVPPAANNVSNDYTIDNDLTELSPCGLYRTINVDLLWEPPSWWGPEPDPVLSVAGCYSITHVPSSRTYIGSSLNIHRRFFGHQERLNRGHHHNAQLQECWNDTPPHLRDTAFRFTVLHEYRLKMDRSTILRDIRAREKHLIHQAALKGEVFNVLSKAERTAQAKASWHQLTKPN